MRAITTTAVINKGKKFKRLGPILSIGKRFKEQLDCYLVKFHKYRYLLLGQLTFLLTTTFPEQAEAFLFNKIETVVTNILTTSGSSVTGADVTNFFNIIRVGVILIFVVGIVYTLVQMWMQNNWVLPLLLVSGFLLAVLAIEFFSNLVLPNSQTTNNNNNGVPTPVTPSGSPLVLPRGPNSENVATTGNNP